jgi:hypothetical protein
MKESTRNEVARLVSSFIDGIPDIDETKLVEIRQSYPFHAAIFSGEALLYSKQERSIVTRMGQKLFPDLAHAIASDRHSDVQSEYVIAGQIDSGSLAQIDKIVGELREGGGRRRPNHVEETKVIEVARSGKMVETRVIADLYVGDFKDGPLFMEIKSPMPNIDVCAQSKHKILVFEEMKRKQNGRGYLAFAYNPWITRSAYKWSFTKTVMDLRAEVLMGSEMWDKLGGDDTYKELLEVLEQTGEAKRTALKQVAKQRTLE